MTARVLITGSSHVAAVKQGWELTCEEGTPPVSVDFLAAPGPIFKEFERRPNGRFGLFKSPGELGLSERVHRVIRDVNGRPFRKPSEFTHSVVVGYRSGVEDMLRMIGEAGVDGIRPTPKGGVTLSQPAFEAFSRDFARRSLPIALRDMLGETVFAVCSLPLRAETAERKGAIEITKRRAAPEGCRELIGRYFEIAAEIFAENGVTLLPQPLDTLTPFGTTDLRYNRGSEHLDDAKDYDDPVHMNGDYGKICISQITNWAMSRALPQGRMAS